MEDIYDAIDFGLRNLYATLSLSLSTINLLQSRSSKVGGLGTKNKSNALHLPGFKVIGLSSPNLHGNALNAPTSDGPLRLFPLDHNIYPGYVRAEHKNVTYLVRAWIGVPPFPPSHLANHSTSAYKVGE